MAKNDDLKHKKDGHSLEDDPIEFCQAIYKEASQRIDDLRERCLENLSIYEGKDAALDARKNNPDVVRSSMFIPLLKPAIDTRFAELLSKLEERRNPITVRPKKQNPSNEEKDKCVWIANELFKQAQECGYLFDVLADHILGAEIYPVSAVKVGWRDVKEVVPEVVEPNPMVSLLGALIGRPPESPKVIFKTKSKGTPYVDWIYPEDFLYQPMVSQFKDSSYVGHRLWLFEHEVYAMAEELDWKKEELDKYIQEAKDNENAGVEGSTAHRSMRDQDAENRGFPYDEGYLDGKFLIVEWYITAYDDDGEEYIRQVTTIGNRNIVKNKRNEFKGIRVPFVLATQNKLPGTFEHLSSVDVGKQLQRMYNESANHYFDAVSYGLFSPIMVPTGFEWRQKPKLAPGAIWEVTDPNETKLLVTMTGDLSTLPTVMEGISAKLRDILNAHDISQGFQANAYEKATSTKLRAMGAARRATPTSKKYGKAIIEVLSMFLSLNQQYSDNQTMWVVDGGVMIDVPSLTAVTDPESDKQDIIMLMAQAAQMPMYQGPLGMRKLRNMFEELMRRFNIQDYEQYIPTEQELEDMIQTQTQMAVNEAEKQSVMGQMALLQQPEETQNAN